MAETNVKNILSWVIGISSIVLVLLVVLIIFGYMRGNTGFPDSVTRISVTNESIAFVNATGKTLSGYNTSWSGITKVRSFNATDDTEFLIGNITISSSGVVTNASANVWEGDDSVLLSYYYDYTGTSYAENQAESVINNVTSGVGKLTAQIPNVFLFVGISLLLFVLVGVLAWVIKRMAKFGSNKERYT